jgi:hypothetical protein
MIISVLGLYLTEWHTNEYARTHNFNLKGKDINKTLTLVTLALIGLSIFFELLKTMIELMCSTKKLKDNRKYFNIDAYLEGKRNKKSQHLDVEINPGRRYHEKKMSKKLVPGHTKLKIPKSKKISIQGLKPEKYSSTRIRSSKLKVKIKTGKSSRLIHSKNSTKAKMVLMKKSGR